MCGRKRVQALVTQCDHDVIRRVSLRVCRGTPVCLRCAPHCDSNKNSSFKIRVSEPRDWLIGNALDSYSGSAPIRFRPGHWLSWMWVSVISSWQMQSSTSVRSRQLPYKSLSLRHLLNIDTDNVLLNTQRKHIRSCRWKRYVPPKHLLTFSGLYSVVYKLIVLFK
jgi:hypothetical protein